MLHALVIQLYWASEEWLEDQKKSIFLDCLLQIKIYSHMMSLAQLLHQTIS
jgi:hypothetical protein